MSIRFLTEEYQENYGRYVGEPTSLQLARYFHLDDRALQLVQKRRGNHNRLGFAVQLGTVRFLGTFLSNPIDVPSGVISYLANQLEIADIDCLTSYSKRVRTHWEHIEEIKHDYGYRDFRSQPRVDTEKGKYSTLSLYPLLRDSYRATILEVIGYAPRLLKTHEIVNEREFCFKNGFREPENLHFPSHHVGCSVFLTNHRL